MTRLIEYSIRALFGAGVAGIIALSFMLTVGPHIGFEPVIIRGSSMEPAVPRGSIVLLTDVPADGPRVGSVVTVRAPNGVLVTHRVERIIESGEPFLALRGDANEQPDAGLAPTSAIVGEVSHVVPVAGYGVALVGHPAGMISVVSFLAALLLAGRLMDEIAAQGATGVDTAAGQATASLLLLPLLVVALAAPSSAAVLRDSETVSARVGSASSWVGLP